MERIKDITKVILPKGHVLLKMHMKEKSQIILADTVTDRNRYDVSYGEIISKASNIEYYDVGDIVMDFGPSEGFKWNDDQYCLVLDLVLGMVVKPDNFDFKMKESISA